MKNYFIDCKNFIDRPSAHEEIASSMHFPIHYGKNLDALWDMLTEITDETLIVLSHSGDADISALPVIALFLEAADENKNIKLIVI
ncbi:MAG: barstar family protein [Eubacteriaceae bacterium]|nr:barstar family protein [Eubacteriaceae bacterium]